MFPRSLLMTIFLITFLEFTSSTSYSSWEPATYSFNSKTNDQTRKRLKQGMPERISQLGGDSMPQSLLYSHENYGHTNNDNNGHEYKHVDPSFRSRDYQNQYREEPLRKMAGGNHLNKNHNFKKRFHGNLESEMSMPLNIHSDRLRRKLDENITQNLNLSHNGTTAETHQKPNEEHKNGTKKPCIKTHPYQILSSPSSNVTHNNSESTTSNTTNEISKPADKKLANNQTVHNSNGTTLSQDGGNQNLTGTMIGKEKLSKDGNLSDKNLTPKSNDTGNSLKQNGQGFGLPCNVNGQWVSEAGGVTLNIKTNQNKSILDVEVLELSPDKKGFLSSSWKIIGNLPFGDTEINKMNGTATTQIGGSVVLTATILKDPTDNSEGKVAVFLGECRVCYEGMESVVGAWSLKRLSKDCMDASLSQKEIRDVLHREANSIAAKEQSKSESSDATKPNDSTDQSKKKHSHRRRSYDKEGKHRKYTRNNLIYI